MDNGASSYRRFLAGDDNGMVEIIRDYKDGLILYLHGFTDNLHIAEELMEDTFVKLAIKKPSFSGKCTFKTWLYTIGRRVAIDFFRHSAKHPTASMEECYDLADNADSLEQAYIKEERKIIVHKALQRLQPDYRQVLYLIYFEDFTNAEAASVMKKSKRQIENLLYRAKASLKSELHKEGFLYEDL